MDHRRSLAAWTLAFALVAVVVVFWLRDRAAPAEPVSPHPSRSGVAAPAHLAAIAPRPTNAPLAAEWPAAAAHDAEDLVAGPANENLVPGAKPHPITSEHRRLYRETGLIDATWMALEEKDFAKARQLIEEHRLEYQGENADLEEGMSLLADCMQHPSAETRARAQRFYDEETYSTARRRIRRWCLDP